MVSFYNPNKDLRNFLDNLYKHLHSTHAENSNIQFLDCIEKIKIEHFSLYKKIIGLAFVDDYAFLKSKEDLQQEEIDLLNIYNQLEDVDDVDFLIDENPSILTKIIASSIKFNRLNQKLQAKMIVNLDNNYIKRFNAFSIIEKNEMFRDKTRYDLINILKDYKEVNNELIFEVKNVLDVLYVGNKNCFFKLMLEMIKTFYKWKKVIQINFPEKTFGIEDEIISIIENKSLLEMIDTLSTDSDFIEVLLTDFLTYELLPNEEKRNIEKLYKKIVSYKIKVKLKEAYLF